MDKFTADTHVSVDAISPCPPDVRATKSPATEEQLDWVDQLESKRLIMDLGANRTRYGNTRLFEKLLACAPRNSGNKNEGPRNG